MTSTVDVRQAAKRGSTVTYWLDSRHSFSFGDYYDPNNTHHGLLLVNNESTLAPGNGFATHPHDNMEVLTWVLDGTITHRDSIGNTETIYPGLAQRMSSGKGILHSEKNEAVDQPVRLVQMWIPPDERDGEPGYEQRDISDALDRGGLVNIASGIPGHDSALGLTHKGAALHGARLAAGSSVDLPAAPYLHLFVGRGQVKVDEAGDLGAGDAARFTASDGVRVTATESSEILVWEMHASLGG
jgi:redox-sensitive bicupin YhaK (pirin superfamily)